MQGRHSCSRCWDDDRIGHQGRVEDSVPGVLADRAIKGTEHECLWLVMMLTGLGPGEALGLGWEHLDLDAGTLRMARTLDCESGVFVYDAKRESRKRTVPLVRELRDATRYAALADAEEARDGALRVPGCAARLRRRSYSGTQCCASRSSTVAGARGRRKLS